MFKLTRLAVAQKLVALQKAGCAVDIVYSQTDSGSSSGTWETLHASGGPALRCYNWDDDGNTKTAARIIHSKYLLIEGKYDGTGALPVPLAGATFPSLPGTRARPGCVGHGLAPAPHGS